MKYKPIFRLILVIDFGCEYLFLRFSITEKKKNYFHIPDNITHYIIKSVHIILLLQTFKIKSKQNLTYYE